ncbi:putative selection and upkeep of intraepithelial T-cells protein 1 homolog isoform X2 [Poecilia formosa]|uniref:putative selection and upkeep of intraepithelial T-cells protein 1 homolog isoform X2 n=1 Tax=Poecilia formosa TaxID=48698 RepID=UPI0007B90D5F|nr:PREDICTED: putative selection and upkeep of intraepithelial T-cells protein 1 homolog isoform X2 [Poecilia formosa]
MTQPEEPERSGYTVIQRALRVMIKRQITAAMELLLSMSFCLLTFTGKSLGDEIELFATEDSDIILPCSPIGKEDLTQQLFDWKKNDKEVFLYDKGKHYNEGKMGQNEYFKNRVEFFQDQLQFGNASIRISKTKQDDSGIYSCEFPNLQPEQKFYIKLVVGSCPKPSLSILKEVNGGMLVQCEAHGAYPEPKMELHDSADVSIVPVNITNPSNGKYIILQAFVTKRDEYHCVMKQEGICHQIYSTRTLVPVASGYDKGLIHGLLYGVIGVAVVVGVLLYFLWWHRRSSGKPYDKTNTSSVDEALKST